MQDIGIAVREALYVLSMHQDSKFRVKEKFSSTIPIRYAKALKAYAKARNVRYSNVIEEIVVMYMQILPYLPQITVQANDVDTFIRDAVVEKLNND